jgi:hypothetical protein
MASYSQEFKVQSVEKALSRRTDQTLDTIADDLRIASMETKDLWAWLRPNDPIDRPVVKKLRLNVASLTDRPDLSLLYQYLILMKWWPLDILIRPV